jgi:hypothetical protein
MLVAAMPRVPNSSSPASRSFWRRTASRSPALTPPYGRDLGAAEPLGWFVEGMTTS